MTNQIFYFKNDKPKIIILYKFNANMVKTGRNYKSEEF